MIPLMRSKAGSSDTGQPASPPREARRARGGVARPRRPAALLWLAFCAVLLAGCNSPYPASKERANTLYTTFGGEPRHLDTARAYGTGQYALLCQIVEPPFQYHLLKRPYVLEPLTATSLPRPETREVSWQGKTIGATVYTIRIKKGIRYQNHPCFVEANRRLSEKDARRVRRVSDFERTATREVTAADYVHAIQRLADPRLSCPILPTLEQNILGLKQYGEALASALEEERERRSAEAGAMYTRQHDEKYNPVRLDYGAYPLPGAREIDRYTFEVVLERPYPQMLYWMAMPFFAPVPPEAVAFFEQRPLLERSIVFDKNPVGTGPYRLAEFDPTNQLVLERNENFRDERYPDLPEPPASDRRARAIYEAMRAEGMLEDTGRRLPMIDKVVFRMEKEWIPRWNKFLQGYYDSSGISGDVFDEAVTLTSEGDSILSDEMADRGIRLLTSSSMVVYYFAFNMADPVVGGYTEKQRKLRQAISIAYDIEELVAIFENGRGTPAHNLIPPGIFGHEEGEAGMNPVVYRWDATPRGSSPPGQLGAPVRSPGEGRPVRRSLEEAKRLLAEAGYPGGYGADGKPLVIRFDNAWTSAAYRPRLKFVAKQFQKLGIRLDIRTTDYNRFQEKVQAGNYQLIRWGWLADYPDPENFLFLVYGPNSRTEGASENNANYASPEFDRLFERMRNMENTPERLAIIRRMNRILQEDAPWIFGHHPVAFALVHEWCRNAYPHAIATNSFKYKRIDTELRAARRRDWNRPRWIPVLIFLAIVAAASIPAVRVAVRHVREA